MKVKDLIEALQEYNSEADVEVIVDGQIPCDFVIYYGGKPGEQEVKKETCQSVELTVFLDKEEL